MTTEQLPTDAPPGPVRLTGYAALQLLLWVPTLALFVLWWLAGVLLIVWIGVPLLLALSLLLSKVARLHRRMAARTLGLEIPDPYRPRGAGLMRRLLGVLLDPMTWREQVWCLASLTVGLAAAFTTVLLLLVVPAWVLWWFGSPRIMELRARMDLFFLSYSRTEVLERRVRTLTATRADAVDHSAAELRRIERDLHDGAQARLVAASMTLGMAEASFEADPDRARGLLEEARLTTSAAIEDLRSVVRGIHPPVLADRGLAGAVAALALDMAVPTDVGIDVPGRPPAPVESAVYFATAECLANIGKHAAAEHAWVRISHGGGVLRAEVGDDGRGGVDPTTGTGLAGIARRLTAFDGTLSLSSPVGGPTIVTLEVPCALSSPKTTPSSAPD